MINRLTISLLAVFALSGCQKQEFDYPKTFTATIDDNSDTKTSLDNEGNILWKKCDQVSIFAGSTSNDKYQVTDAFDGQKTAELTKISETGSGSKITNNVAFYPYSSTASITNNGNNYVISGINLPSTQYYEEGSFGNGAFPMTAVTDSPSDTSLKFKNILGGIKIQLKGTATIKSISIKGNSNEVLCGSAKVTAIANNVPSITMSGDSINVTLDCGEGVALNSESATSFIIALPPMTMTTGFIVTIYDAENGRMIIKTTKSQTIARSNVLQIPEVEYSLEEPSKMEGVDLGLSIKWASCNIGASKPEDYGTYFAWGDVVGQTWNGSSWSGGGFSTYHSYGVDAKNNLKPEYDAAHVILGGTWRMPTKAEFQELIGNCTSEWTTVGGVYGRLFTSKKAGYTDKSIFLPAGGVGLVSGRGSVGSIGYYWSSTFYSGSNDAWYLGFYSGIVGTYHDCHYIGRSVRPVTE